MNVEKDEFLEVYLNSVEKNPSLIGLSSAEYYSSVSNARNRIRNSINGLSSFFETEDLAILQKPNPNFPLYSDGYLFTTKNSKLHYSIPNNKGSCNFNIYAELFDSEYFSKQGINDLDYKRSSGYFNISLLNYLDPMHLTGGYSPLELYSTIPALFDLCKEHSLFEILIEDNDLGKKVSNINDLKIKQLKQLELGELTFLDLLPDDLLCLEKN